MDTSRKRELEKLAIQAINQREQLLLRAKAIAQKTEARVREILNDRSRQQWPRGFVAS
jgi:hypothetical protein